MEDYGSLTKLNRNEYNDENGEVYLGGNWFD